MVIYMNLTYDLTTTEGLVSECDLLLNYQSHTLSLSCYKKGRGYGQEFLLCTYRRYKYGTTWPADNLSQVYYNQGGIQSLDNFGQGLYIDYSLLLLYLLHIRGVLRSREFLVKSRF